MEWRENGEWQGDIPTRVCLWFTRSLGDCLWFTSFSGRIVPFPLCNIHDTQLLSVDVVIAFPQEQHRYSPVPLCCDPSVSPFSALPSAASPASLLARLAPPSRSPSNSPSNMARLAIHQQHNLHNLQSHSPLLQSPPSAKHINDLKLLNPFLHTKPQTMKIAANPANLNNSPSSNLVNSRYWIYLKDTLERLVSSYFVNAS
ncbi:hypothetical protein BKA69DRAFT_159831 [Paraphysoderma sedebokerense]|nr:hypothetical protein BKA69DRAFT_159831 [Paraphysoderma sedebokerense]